MPTASETAPPVRPATVSCTAASSAGRFVTAMPERREHRRRRVDREVVAGVQRARRDERDDADEALHQHRAVADDADVRLLVDHLRRRARRDQRVEAGDRAARDGDEHERKERARHDRAAAAGELRERRHLEHRVDDDHADDEQRDRADLHERAR